MRLDGLLNLQVPGLEIRISLFRPPAPPFLEGFVKRNSAA